MGREARKSPSAHETLYSTAALFRRLCSSETSATDSRTLSAPDTLGWRIMIIPPGSGLSFCAVFAPPDLFAIPMCIVESIQHDETKTPGRYITQDLDVKGHYSVHVFRQCVSASALAYRNLPAALQTTLLNDTEGLLAAWKRIMLTCDPVTLAAFLLLARWVIRVFNLQ